MKASQCGQSRTKQISMNADHILRPYYTGWVVPKLSPNQEVLNQFILAIQQVTASSATRLFLSTNTELCRKKSVQCKGMRKAAQLL